jgi:hypothetical protein
MAQEEHAPPSTTDGRFSPDELRAAARTLLALAAEHESRGGTLVFPHGFDWLTSGRGTEVTVVFDADGREHRLLTVPEVTAFPGLADGAGEASRLRRERGTGCLARAVECLLAEHRHRVEDVAEDEAAAIEAVEAPRIIAAVRRAAARGRMPLHDAVKALPVLDASLPWLWLHEVDRLMKTGTAVPAENEGRTKDTDARHVPVFHPDDRAALVLLIVVAARMHGAGQRGEPLDLETQIAAVARELDKRRGRVRSSNYDEVVRAVLRVAAQPVDARGPTSAPDLATEVGDDEDRPTSPERAARKNQLRRSAYYALAALGCGGDLTAAVDEAEPVRTKPTFKV